VAEQLYEDLIVPRILIVSDDNALHRRLGYAFMPYSVELESARNARDSIVRMRILEPPITGVVTDGLRGEYHSVINAAREIDARVALVVSSTLAFRNAQSEHIPVCMSHRLKGRQREKKSAVSWLINTLITQEVAD
jgi:hypothetical protein